MHDLQQVLSAKMHLDSDAAASFVAGLHLYMDDDPYKVSLDTRPSDTVYWHTHLNVLTRGVYSPRGNSLQGFFVFSHSVQH